MTVRKGWQAIAHFEAENMARYGSGVISGRCMAHSNSNTDQISDI